MYQINVGLRGVCPMLHNAFSKNTLEHLQEGATKKTASGDYSLEWMKTMYMNLSKGHLFQPSTHIEGTLVKSAASFTIKGKRGKTYKDAMNAYVMVSPDEIPLRHEMLDGDVIPIPSAELMTEPTDYLWVDVRRVKIQRAAVAKSRLAIGEGWLLDFNMMCSDDTLRPDVIQMALAHAGHAIGISDFRPKFGRFEIMKFEVS